MAAQPKDQDGRISEMNKLTTKLLMAALAATLAAGPCLAAKSKPAGDKGEPRVDRRLQMLSRKLDLSEDQTLKLKEAFTARREAVKPLRKELRETMKELREQVRGEEDDKKIGATLDELKKLRKSMKAANEKFQEKLEGVLKPGQRAKMMLAMGKRHRPGAMNKRGQGGKARYRKGRGPARGQGRGWDDEDFGPRGRGRRGGGPGWGGGQGWDRDF